MWADGYPVPRVYGDDGDDYLATLTKILEKKAATITEKDTFKRRYKLIQYALGRGFENDLIADVLKANEL